jgi:hypothetical protein
MGAWMNKASIGRFKVEGYLYNVTWIDNLKVSLFTQSATRSNKDVHIDDIEENDDSGTNEEL